MKEYTTKYQVNSHKILTSDNYTFSSQGKLLNDIFADNKETYKAVLQKIISQDLTQKLDSSVNVMRED